MGHEPEWRSGDPWMVCDRCGFDYRRSEMRKEWNGKWVCAASCWEARHPSEYPRRARDKQAVKEARPAPATHSTDSYVGGGFEYLTLGDYYDAGATVINPLSALIDRMDSPPTLERLGVMNTLIHTLYTAGIWTQLDLFYVFAVHDEQTALLNWISSSFDATAVSAPTFTADSGYTFDGSADYLTTGFDPSVDGVNFTSAAAGATEGCSLGVYVVGATSDAADTSVAMGVYDGSTQCVVNPWRATAGIGSAMQFASITTVGSSIATRIGMSAAQREELTIERVYRDGSETQSGAKGLGDMPSGFGMYIGARNNQDTADSFSSDTIGAAYAGGDLTATDHATLYSALNTYLDAVGAV